MIRTSCCGDSKSSQRSLRLDSITLLRVLKSLRDTFPTKIATILFSWCGRNKINFSLFGFSLRFKLDACLSSWIDTLVSGMRQNTHVFSSLDASIGVTAPIRALSHDAGKPYSFRFPLSDKSIYWCACFGSWCCYLSQAYGWDSGRTS